MNLHCVRNPGLTAQNDQHKTPVGHRETDVQNRCGNSGMPKLLCVRGNFLFILNNIGILHRSAALFKYCTKTNWN